MADLDRLDALARAYDAAVHKIRQDLTAFASQMWASMPDYRDEAVEAMAQALAPRVLAGQLQTAELTRAYLIGCASELGLTVTVPAIDREAVTGMRGVDPLKVYQRPGMTTWTALSRGKTLDQAVSAGGLAPLDRPRELRPVRHRLHSALPRREPATHPSGVRLQRWSPARGHGCGPGHRRGDPGGRPQGCRGPHGSLRPGRPPAGVQGHHPDHRARRVRAGHLLQGDETGPPQGPGTEGVDDGYANQFRGTQMASSRRQREGRRPGRNDPPGPRGTHCPGPGRPRPHGSLPGGRPHPRGQEPRRRDRRRDLGVQGTQGRLREEHDFRPVQEGTQAGIPPRHRPAPLRPLRRGRDRADRAPFSRAVTNHPCHRHQSRRHGGVPHVKVPAKCLRCLM